MAANTSGVDDDGEDDYFVIDNMNLLTAIFLIHVVKYVCLHFLMIFL